MGHCGAGQTVQVSLLLLCLLLGLKLAEQKESGASKDSVAPTGRELAPAAALPAVTASPSDPRLACKRGRLSESRATLTSPELGAREEEA